MRAISGIVVGLIVSVIISVIAGIAALGATYPLPPGIHATDPNEVLRVFKAIPQTAQLALAAAWAIGALAGAFVARRIARQAWPAWAVSLVVAGYFGLNALLLEQPVWVEALWIVAPLIGGLIGSRLVRDGAVVEAGTDEAGEEPADATVQAEAPPA